MPDQTVIIGASRSKYGIDTAELARQFNGVRPIQLAIAGSICFPVFQYLVDETDFDGLILYDVHPGAIAGIPHFGEPAMQAQWVESFHHIAYVNDIETSLSVALDRLFVFRRTDLTLKEVLVAGVETKALPTPDKRILPDRSGMIDFQHRKVQTGPTKSTKSDGRRCDPAVVSQKVAEIKALVEKLQSRGGQVVFVRMPSSGPMLANENLEFPRSMEWDVLASAVPAPTIHFEDFDGLSPYECPDGGHLDYRDSTPFTRSLAEIIHQKLQNDSGKKSLSIRGSRAAENHR